MGATTYARANDILDMLDSKGPTTESERIYRKVKTPVSYTHLTLPTKRIV